MPLINKIMKSFKQWREAVDAPATDNTTTGQTPAVDPSGMYLPGGKKLTTKDYLKKYKIKPWKASKDEIMSFWRTLGTELPIQIKPIPYDHEGSSIQEDGVRITGSKEFISSTLSKLKDFIRFENQNTKLMVAYRQSPRSFLPGSKNSYIFYLQVMDRGKD